MRPKAAAIAVAVTSLLGVGASTLGTPAGASVANAPKTTVYRVNLRQLNHSGASGVAILRLTGVQLDVLIDAKHLLPNSVHAQHIHGAGSSECPPPSAAGPDGILSTTDGLPFYGPIVSSLTTSGDTSPAAGLTIELMPVANARGVIHYHRTITLAPEVAANIRDFQIVQHGVDFNHSGAYDFGAGPSDLKAELPQEATAPADCGTIDLNPHRQVHHRNRHHRR